MAIINDVTEVLHHLKVKLYFNYLSTVKGLYIARTDNEASLTIEDICAALKNRGGYTGSYEDLVECVRQFFGEAAYQLCDGFAVNTGYFSIHPNVGGTFDKVNEGHDARKHPITFRFRARAPLRTLAEHIVVDVEGVADAACYIDEFVDIKTGAENETLTPGGQFSISGHKIKIAGEDADIGVYFVSETEERVKADEPLAENTASKLIGVIPALGVGTWRVEIKTQYSGGSNFLKEPRTAALGVGLVVKEPT